jgi:hypothetical protein
MLLNKKETETYVQIEKTKNIIKLATWAIIIINIK